MLHRLDLLILSALWLTVPLMSSCAGSDDTEDGGETRGAMTALIWDSPPPPNSVVGAELAVAFSVETTGVIDATTIRVCAEEAGCGLGPQGSYVEFPATAGEGDFRAAFMLELGVWWVVAYARIDDDHHVSDAVLVTIDPG